MTEAPSFISYYLDPAGILDASIYLDEQTNVEDAGKEFKSKTYDSENRKKSLSLDFEPPHYFDEGF